EHGRRPRPAPRHLPAPLPAAVGRQVLRDAGGPPAAAPGARPERPALDPGHRPAAGSARPCDPRPGRREPLLHRGAVPGRPGDAPAPLGVPDRVQGVLLARIVPLRMEPRRLLQPAAVLGRQAPLPLLRDLWDGPGDLEPHLRELTRLEFLYPASGGSEPLYAF